MLRSTRLSSLVDHVPVTGILYQRSERGCADPCKLRSNGSFVLCGWPLRRAALPHSIACRRSAKGRSRRFVPTLSPVSKSTKFHQTPPNSIFRFPTPLFHKPSFPFIQLHSHPLSFTDLTNVLLPCGSRGPPFKSGRWYHLSGYLTYMLE